MRPLSRSEINEIRLKREVDRMDIVSLCECATTLSDILDRERLSRTEEQAQVRLDAVAMREECEARKTELLMVRSEFGRMSAKTSRFEEQTLGVEAGLISKIKDLEIVSSKLLSVKERLATTEKAAFDFDMKIREQSSAIKMMLHHITTLRVEMMYQMEMWMTVESILHREAAGTGQPSVLERGKIIQRIKTVLESTKGEIL